MTSASLAMRMKKTTDKWLTFKSHISTILFGLFNFRNEIPNAPRTGERFLFFAWKTTEQRKIPGHGMLPYFLFYTPYQNRLLVNN